MVCAQPYGAVGTERGCIEKAGDCVVLEASCMKADQSIHLVERKPQVSARVLEDGSNAVTGAGGVFEHRDVPMV